MRRNALGFLLVLMVVLTACGGPTDPQEIVPVQQPRLNMAEFFPTDVGTEWAYRIEVRDAEPLGYDEMYWPLAGDQLMGYASRKRYAAAMDGSKNFNLKLQVKGTAAQQGPLQYPKGVELAVLTDDLGLYQDVKHIFWAVRGADQTSEFAVEKIVMYDQLSPVAPGGGGFGMVTGDGYTHQMAFFIKTPGTAIGFGKDPTESLVFVGIEPSVYGYTGGPLLHFRREVKASDDKSGSVLDSAFTEDMWFAKDKGMVVLEQKVDGKTSMVWTLANP